MGKIDKKLLCLLSVVIFSYSMVVAFSSEKLQQEGSEQQQNMTAINGHVVIYGSEPHTFPGIVTDDGKVYTIKAGKDILVKLYAEQGKYLQFFGTILPPGNSGGASFQTLKDGSFVLKSWKVVSE